MGNPIADGDTVYADMTLVKGVMYATDEATKQVLYSLARRVSAIKPYQDRLRLICDRMDALYYPPDIHPTAGADSFWDDPNLGKKGRAHVAVNGHPLYVDIPAAMESVEPIENMVATDTSEAAKNHAAAEERLYTAWKRENDYELFWHRAATVKELYGIAASRLYWDPDDRTVEVELIDQPKHLWLGWRNDNYYELEWAAYCTRWEPNALAEEFGVDVQPIIDERGETVPVVRLSDWNDEAPNRPFLQIGDARIEVWDYWYRQPVWRGTKFVRMDTYNVVIAGNVVVREPTVYREYKGDLPFLPVFNTYIPGMPAGRPALYDVEQILREKTERITAGAQMIHNAVAGDYWQLVGAEAPRVPQPGLTPVRNGVIYPGPGNRLEALTPFIAQVQLDQYLDRLDREAAAETGINDLLLGLAPSAVLNSSKAINALIANFESRLSIRRKLMYKWRRDMWDMARDILIAKDKRVATIIGDSKSYLDIIDPSLSPRDEGETAVRAGNLVNAKLWSQARGMDAVGVDDPETEQQRIREESTDATLWPERVQVMAQLISVLQQLGLNAPQGVQAQAQGQISSGQSDLRNALGLATPQVGPGAPGAGGEPSMMGQTPPLPGMPPEAGGPPAPFQSGPAVQPGPTQLQTMVQGGSVKGRILNQTTLGRR